MATHFSLLFKGSGLLAGTGVYFTYIYIYIMKTPSTMFENTCFARGKLLY